MNKTLSSARVVDSVKIEMNSFKLNLFAKKSFAKERGVKEKKAVND